MNLHSIRYMYEHRLLPSLFYEDTKQFVRLLLHDKGLLFKMIDDIFEKENVQNPYVESDFDLDAAKVKDDVLMMQISFPEPEDEPLCYRAYLFFDISFEKCCYFCIEKGNVEGDMYPFVCSWSPDGCHYNYGNCTLEEYDDFIRCGKLYMEQQYELTTDGE